MASPQTPAGESAGKTASDRVRTPEGWDTITAGMLRAHDTSLAFGSTIIRDLNGAVFGMARYVPDTMPGEELAATEVAHILVKSRADHGVLYRFAHTHLERAKLLERVTGLFNEIGADTLNRLRASTYCADDFVPSAKVRLRSQIVGDLFRALEKSWFNEDTAGDIATNIRNLRPGTEVTLGVSPAGQGYTRIRYMDAGELTK